MDQIIFEKIKPIIADRLNVELCEITPEKTFRDLGGDSLDGVDVIMEIEKQCDVAIPDEDMEKLTNIESIVNYIEENSK